MKFKYKFSTVLYVLFGVGYVLAVICFLWNLIRLVGWINQGFQMSVYDYASVGLCILLPVVYAVFGTASLLNSNYTIGEKKLEINFGFIKEGFAINDVKEVVKYLKTNKLSVVFKDESVYFIVIDSSKFNDFSHELIQKNKYITYSESDEEITKSK